jgi:hypothetical protein
MNDLVEEQRRGLMKNFATMKFKEFDKDHSGFLEMTEINAVIDWLLDLNQDVRFLTALSTFMSVMQ